MSDETMSDETMHEPVPAAPAAPPSPPVYPRGAGMPAYNGLTCPKCGGKLVDCGPTARPTRPPTVGTVCPACHAAGVREV